MSKEKDEQKECETVLPSEEQETGESKKESRKDLSKMKKELEATKKELQKVKEDLEEQKEQAASQNDRYLRMMAEYDNFRKRAAAEKDAVYNGALTDVLTEILPVIDTLELAMKYTEGSENLLKGVEMTLAKFKEVLEKLGVSEVETKTFDPNFHNAVMHVEDEQAGEGEILEVFQKGYKKGDKIIRYAMVKVAN